MKKFITFVLCLSAMLCAHAENVVMDSAAANVAETNAELAAEQPVSNEAPAAFDASNVNSCVVVNPSESASPLYAPEKISYQTGIRPYKFLDDVTFSGVPLFVAGILAKSQKTAFRQDYNNTHSRTRLVTNFHSTVDNYTQFAPLVLATGLNFAGYKGRSKTWRYAASAAMSYAFMALFVNGIKYTAKEMRPDGSTRNSWPSGHTATTFCGATILHHEYGLTRSPWFSVGGYAVATATGIMRVLNNRHWVSDVLSGAGIGILSTELAYGLSDILFKGKGLNMGMRNDLSDITTHPSFFAVEMGLGIGSRNMTFSGKDLEVKSSDGEDIDWDEMDDVDLQFRSSTVVGVEGAYFFNKYFGLGGRLRVKAMPINGWGRITAMEEEYIQGMIKEYQSDPEMSNIISTKSGLTIESDHLTEFIGDLGVYFNLPLSKRWAIGAKLLGGRSVMSDLDVNGHFEGDKLAFSGDYDVVKTGSYSLDWDYLTLHGSSSFSWGTGINVTFAYKNSFVWKIFADFDNTRKTYTLEYDPDLWLKTAFKDLYDAVVGEYNISLEKRTSTIKKTMNNWVFGAAFTVSF